MRHGTCRPLAPASVEGYLESVIDPSGPVRGRDRQRELDDLFLVEMGTQGFQIGLFDILRPCGQEVGVPQDGLFFSGKEAGPALASWLF